jgi:hypothetical protein
MCLKLSLWGAYILMHMKGSTIGRRLTEEIAIWEKPQITKSTHPCRQTLEFLRSHTPGKKKRKKMLN